MNCTVDSLTVKNIVYFPNSMDHQAGLVDQVEHGGFWRFHGKIVSIGGALKLAGAAHKGTGDDAAHFVLAP